ncbi:MAG: hypothetical protein QXU98_13530 [Candidatus Parvarchaeota archaeon]
MKGKHVIFCDRRERRDFIYIEDSPRPLLLALKYETPGVAYNVGTVISIDFRTRFFIMKEEVNYKGLPDYQPKPLKSYHTFT